MHKIKIFLASSNELESERRLFEIEIYRKCKAWFDKGIFLHLDVWEDLSARMSALGSQDAYNQYVRSADLFILLAFTKFGIYSGEEFRNAFGQFRDTQKPFIFIYFKMATGVVDESITRFKEELQALGHYYSHFGDANDLWNQFNKEMERLESSGFNKNERPDALTVQQTDEVHQHATKIYNIKKIDKADFS